MSDESGFGRGQEGAEGGADGGEEVLDDDVREDADELRFSNGLAGESERARKMERRTWERVVSSVACRPAAVLPDSDKQANPSGMPPAARTVVKQASRSATVSAERSPWARLTAAKAESIAALMLRAAAAAALPAALSAVRVEVATSVTVMSSGAAVAVAVMVPLLVTVSVCVETAPRAVLVRTRVTVKDR